MPIPEQPVPRPKLTPRPGPVPSASLPPRPSMKPPISRPHAPSAPQQQRTAPQSVPADNAVQEPHRRGINRQQNSSDSAVSETPAPNRNFGQRVQSPQTNSARQTPEQSHQPQFQRAPQPQYQPQQQPYANNQRPPQQQQFRSDGPPQQQQQFQQAPQRKSKMPWWIWLIIGVGALVVIGSFAFAAKIIFSSSGNSLGEDGTYVGTEKDYANGEVFTDDGIPPSYIPASFKSFQIYNYDEVYVHRKDIFWSPKVESKLYDLGAYGNSDENSWILMGVAEKGSGKVATDNDAFKEFAADYAVRLSDDYGLGGVTTVSEIQSNPEGFPQLSVSYKTGGDTGFIEAVTIFSVTGVQQVGGDETTKQIVYATSMLSNEEGRLDYQQMVITSQDVRYERKTDYNY